MGDFYNKAKYTSLRRKLRQTMPKGERLLWNKLRNNQLNFKFRRQFSIDNFVVDFCCPKLKLIVEIDGLSHAEEDIFEKDQKREEFLSSLGFIFKRYNSKDVFEKTEEVVTDIFYTCEFLDEKATSPQSSPCKGEDGGGETPSP